MLGTEWVTPGTGVTVQELLFEVIQQKVAFVDPEIERQIKEQAIARLKSFPQYYITTLRFTGQPLQPYDLERIAAVEAQSLRNPHLRQQFDDPVIIIIPPPNPIIKS